MQEISEPISWICKFSGCKLLPFPHKGGNSKGRKGTPGETATDMASGGASLSERTGVGRSGRD